MKNSGHSDRIPSAAGRFYPASKEALLSQIKGLMAENAGRKQHENIRALIVPHAGYVFSGRVAAAAFHSVPAETKFENIILIGSSHLASFRGASVYNRGDFLTPLGRLTVNHEICGRLTDESDLFGFSNDAHLHEHSLEVQLPFIQYHFRHQPKIVPILLGTSDQTILQAVAQSLEQLFTPENLFIVSTDFSHYPSSEDARRVDTETAGAIMSGDPGELLRIVSGHRKESVSGLATSMCGLSAGLVLMYLAGKDGSCRFHHIMYMNSGDSECGDNDRVVGYHSFILAGKNTASGRFESYSELNFSSDDRKMLMEIARSSIESGLKGRYGTVKPEIIPDSLRISAGAFVSLHRGGNLRGCIGRLTSSEPLGSLVADMAYSAAFEDSRFEPLTHDEYPETEIEISVISPLRKVTGKDEIIIGKHGVCLRKSGRSGVLLPQVATERGWSVKEFLEHAAEKKAGIGKDGWKDADIFVFEAVVIAEND